MSESKSRNESRKAFLVGVIPKYMILLVYAVNAMTKQHNLQVKRDKSE